MGDFNTPLNNEREEQSISTGMSGNGFKKDAIKYPGQYVLFNILANTVPDDFMEVRVLPKEHGEKKPVDPQLLQEAIAKNLFTGSTLSVPELKTNKNTMNLITRQQSEYRLIDGIFMSKDGATGNLQTQLISLNEFTAYPFELSDHFTVIGNFSLANQ